MLTLDPLNARAFRSAGNIAFAARDYSSTIAAMQQALKLNPKISAASVAIGNAHYLNGRLPEAIAAYQAEPAALFAQTGLAIAQHRAGNRAAAQAALNRLRSEFGNNSFYQQGEVLAQWGDVDGAFARLDQARKLMDSGLLLTPTDPMLDPLRADPRFADLLSWLEARKF